MTGLMSHTIVCGRPLDECLQIVEDFHGFKAPGLVLGIFIVGLARELIGPNVEADAVVETRNCLPDAVQLFTPCTVGNGWMKILDWDKFAVTLYDRHDPRGYRVWLDLEKTRTFPNLYNWYMRRVPKEELPLEVLLETIFEAGYGVLSAAAVTLTRLHRRGEKGQTAVCPCCGEAYGVTQGLVCAACRGENYCKPIKAEAVGDVADGGIGSRPIYKTLCDTPYRMSRIPSLENHKIRKESHNGHR